MAGPAATAAVSSFPPSAISGPRAGNGCPGGDGGPNSGSVAATAGSSGSSGLLLAPVPRRPGGGGTRRNVTPRSASASAIVGSSPEKSGITSLSPSPRSRNG
ncbi:unnamed protein product, partial [Discosporangium mesarthrocarpum]